MSEHNEIMTEMQRQYEGLQDAVIVGPQALAWRVYEVIATGEEDARVQYLSLEHLKQMARKFLARKHDTESDETEAYQAQGTLFSGLLQDRYPLPRKGSEEPVYKLRHELTAEERAWNVEQLRKSAGARLRHADALEAEPTANAA